jgi:hypothetical protein
VAVEVLERIDRRYRGKCHGEKSMAGQARLSVTIFDIAQIHGCRTGLPARPSRKPRKAR